MKITEPAIIKLAHALAELMGNTQETIPPSVTTARYVTIVLASVKTGYSEKAIRRKIEDGVWIEGREYVRAPDGHIMIDMEGMEKWVVKGAASKSAKLASA